MAEKEMNAIVKNVTKTTSEWESVTEIPAKGTICVETTTDGNTKIKIGDGVNAFSGLEYIDCKNAATLEGLRANEIANNPNLLINPDFRNPVNQRGLSEYASAGYTIDRWRLSSNGNLKINEGSITVASTNNSPTYFLQALEDYNMLDGMDVTLTVCDENNNVYTATGKIPTGTVAQYTAILTVTFGVCQFILWKRSDGELLAQAHIPAGKSASIKWVKLEAGAIATPFVSPDMATELLKCQRYYATIGQIIFSAKTNMIPYQNYYSLPVTMRVNPTIIVSDADNDMGFASLRNNSSIKISINTACNDNRYINIWAPNNDMVINSEYRIIITASAEL